MSLQGTVAVIAGFVVMAAIVMAGTATAAVAMGRSLSDSSRPPPGYLLFDFSLGMTAALAGGALTGWLAPSAPLGHAGALSVLVLAMAVYCLMADGDNGAPRWYQAAMSLASAQVVIAGAWLAAA